MFRNHEMDNFLGSINLLRQSGNELKTAAIYKVSIIYHIKVIIIMIIIADASIDMEYY